MRTHLSAAIKHWGLYKGNHIAIFGESAITYQQLDRAGEYVAALLRKLTKAKRIAVSVKDQALLIACILGCSRANKTFVLIDPEDNEKYYHQLDSIERRIHILTDSYSMSGFSYDVITDKAFEFIDFNNGQYDVPPFGEAAILFTSGTTGSPKGVIRNNFSLLSEGILWIIELCVTQNTRFMVSRPLYWTGGFVFMYATLFCGGQLLVSKENNERELLHRAFDDPVDIAFLIPSQIHNLIRSPIKSESQFTEKVITMGAPISARAKEKFSDYYRCSIIEAWGNSEGLGTITKAEDISIRPTSIGRPCFCDSLEVIDSGGRSCDTNQPGILAGVSDNQFSSYSHEHEKSDNFDHKTRLIHSEDIGFRDDDGCFYILGRSSEKVTIDGNDIFPSFIEKMAMDYEFVNDAALILDKDSIGTAQLLLLVSIKQSAQLNDFQARLNSQLPIEYGITTVVQVDKIPRNESGKISRYDAQRMYEEHYRCQRDTLSGKS